MSGCLTAYRQIVGSEIQVVGKYFFTDFNTAWKSVLEALDNQPLELPNREAGFIQTKWIDNTAQKNFTDSFGNSDFYNKTQYRLKITLARGFFEGRPTVKITVQREQMVQKDVLEDWKRIETDLIEENTFLYRIERIVFMRTKLAKMEEERIRKELDKSETPSNDLDLDKDDELDEEMDSKLK